MASKKKKEGAGVGTNPRRKSTEEFIRSALGSTEREPGWEYGTVLPVRVKKDKTGKKEREWGLGYSDTAKGMLEAVTAPRKAMQGKEFTPEEAMQFAMGVTAPGVATARYVPGMANMPIVYHGTPHKFAPTPENPLGEFIASKIGTGEGAQAYGHGVYLAENPDVAKGYQSNLTASMPAPATVAALSDKAGDASKKKLWIIDEGEVREASADDVLYLDPDLQVAAFAENEKDALRLAEKYDRGELQPDNVTFDAGRTGSLYTADLPDKMVDRMLDWDKPLSEQVEVQKALKGTDYEVGISNKEAEKIADMRLRHEADDWAEETGGDPVDYINNANWDKYVDDARRSSGNVDSSITGKQLHDMIMRDSGYNPQLFDSYNYQVDTSETLRNFGIPGIKYLDQVSRDKGKGTRNFVLFPGEEKKAKIIKRD